MQCRGLTLVVVATIAVVPGIAIAPASADDPKGGPIVVSDGYGTVDTTIAVPGSPGGTNSTSASGGGVASGATCNYVLDTSNITHHPQDYPGLATSDFTKGTYYYRYCSDGTAGFVWVPNPRSGAPAGVPTVTPARLAQEVSDQLPLSRPTIRRSPNQDLRYRGDPYTWVNLWTWFWTDPASFKALTQTVSLGGVSVTVIAKPVGLLFDPGDGSNPVRCDGPGRAWTDADGNGPPSSGCGFAYTHVTNGTVQTRVAILWQVSWTGTGGAGGVLPQLRTEATAPLRVLQAQVVNR
jgi:hypothetical protein